MVEEIVIEPKLREELCSRLAELKKMVEENLERIPTGHFTLFHIVRSMQLLGCPIEKTPPTEKIIEEIKKIERKGVILE